MSRLIEVLKDIKSAEEEIRKQISKKETAKKEIENLLGNNFISYTPLKELIDECLYKNFTTEIKEKVDKKRDKKEKQYNTLTSASFDPSTGEYQYGSCSIEADDGIFDPKVDSWEIHSYMLNPNNEKQIRITVDAIKNRKFLGISGAWIPDLYQTEWINIDDIVKLEGEKKCFIKFTK